MSSIFDVDAVQSDFIANDISLKHMQVLYRHLIQRQTPLENIPLPKRAYQVLKNYALMSSKVIQRIDSSDGSTTKLLIELKCKSKIESVIMRYGNVQLDSFPETELKTVQGKPVFKSSKRATLCVSSQVGCAMGCTFCATGTMNLLSNLSSGEIIEQLIHANKVETIRNVVFMGMGEPLDNYEAVLTAIKTMVDTSRFGLSPSRISLSTVGVVPRLRQLMTDLPDIGLALSLHAPTQELRKQIVPTSKAWPIHKILEATDAFIIHQNTRFPSNSRTRRVLVEYVLIADINDSLEVASQLGELLKDRHVLLNVIPYNPTAVPYNYKSPSREQTSSFVERVRSFGVHTLLRQELGQDVDSACGQLVIDSKSCSTPDLEDLVSSNNIKQKPRIVKRKKEKSNELVSVKERIGLTLVIYFIIATLTYLLFKYCFRLLGLAF